MSKYDYTDVVWDFWDKLFSKFHPNYSHYLKTTNRLDLKGIDTYVIFEFEDGFELSSFQLKMREIGKNPNIKKIRDYTLTLSYLSEKGYPCAFGHYFTKKSFNYIAFGFPLLGFGLVFTYTAFKRFWDNFYWQDVHVQYGSGNSEYYEVAIGEVVQDMEQGKDYVFISGLPKLSNQAQLRDI